MTYRLLFKSVLTRMDPERAHVYAARSLAAVHRVAPLRRAIERRLRPTDPRLTVSVLGHSFPSPLGVAAGMDKDAECFDALGMLGFGFVEVGTITPSRQAGNDRPRVWRLVDESAVINAMGFPNKGADHACRRLATRTGNTIVGANIGKAKDTPNGDAAADYRRVARHVAPLADFVVLNVSSPNTVGLREMQAAEALTQIVREVRAEMAEQGHVRPLLVKIAPDLTDGEIDAVADTAVAEGVEGIIAVNTTVDRSVLRGSEPDGVNGRGGISGQPLKPRALEVLRRLRSRVEDRVVLISVGGVASAEDAMERILEGASLVQAHTGFVYGGPLWPYRFNRELARLVEAHGADSIQDLVGAGAASKAAQPAPHVLTA